MAIVHPPTLINAYLGAKILEPDPFEYTIPFLPTSPQTIDILTQSFPSGGNDDLSIGGPGGLFAVYDRMFKMRRKAFPHIKDEQILYYFYGTKSNAIEYLFDISQKVQDLLDRGDESAQEVNAWISSQLTDGIYIKQNKEFLPVHFHDFKIYQLEETRDIIDFGTARTYAGNKIIIDYCYHTVGEKLVNGVRTYNNTVIN